MSVKINKNGKEYPLAVLPQNIIEKVLRLDMRTVSGSGYIIYSIGDILIVQLADYTSASGNLPIVLDSTALGVSQFYDTLSKDNIHMNIGQNGAVTVNSSSDITLSTYSIYGSCVLIGAIAD